MNESAAAANRWVDAASPADVGMVASWQIDLLRGSILQAAPPNCEAAINKVLSRLDLQQIQDQFFRQIRASRPDWAVFCARDAKVVEPCGFVLFGPAEPIELPVSKTDTQILPSGIEIASLMVEAKYRGLGHGSRLLEATVKRAKSLNLANIRCWISADNQGAQQFFSGAGFAPAGKRRQLDMGEINYLEHLWYTRL